MKRPHPAAYPLALTLLRLVLGPTAIFLAARESATWVFIPILCAGFLSDYFDGVVARRLHVAYPWVRRADSLTDVVFYLCVLVAVWLVARPVILAGLIPVALCLIGEVACNGVSLAKFKRLPATHSLLAKCYGLCLFVVMLGILSFGFGPGALWILAIVSLLANAEVVAMMLIAKQPPVDVLSIVHLRQQLREAKTADLVLTKD